MTLEVLIVTYGQAGLDKVVAMNLPSLSGVKYLISLQNPDENIIEYPNALIRNDFRIIETNSFGSGANRANALKHAEGDILLMSDDDLVYNEINLLRIIEIFENDKDLDLATFRYSGSDAKIYPEYSFDLNKEPKGYYITAFEVAVRRQSLIKSMVSFSKYLGAGMNLFSTGEENLFVYRLLKAGLKGRFFPITIVDHPELTTGCRKATSTSLRGQGNWLRLRYGTFMGYLRLIRDIPRKKAPWYKSLFFMTQGFILSYFYFTKDGKDRKKITRHRDEQSL